MSRRYVVYCAIVAGCSSGGPNAPGPSPDAAAPRADSGGDEPFVCAGPGYGSPPQLVPFERLEATVVDLDGTPVSSLRAQACGLNLCLNADTRGDGTVAIASAAEFDRLAFKYGLGRETAKFAQRLEGGPVHLLGTVATVPLPSPSTGQPLVAGGAVTSGDVTLTLALEMNPIEIDPFDFDSEELRGFRAARVPTDAPIPALDGTLELAYALTPVGARLCPATAMTVPNTLDWPPGTRVEFLLHGVEIDEEWAPYGGWAKVAGGAVSDDGSAITTDEGSGIPILSVIGIRRAP